MKIKINDQNIVALQAAVKKSNGSATAHTFISWHSLLECARQAEATLEHLSLAKSLRSGATDTSWINFLRRTPAVCHRRGVAPRRLAVALWLGVRIENRKTLSSENIPEGALV